MNNHFKHSVLLLSFLSFYFYLFYYLNYYYQYYFLYFIVEKLPQIIQINHI